MARRTNVRQHVRRLPSGRKTQVVRHSRKIQGSMSQAVNLSGLSSTTTFDRMKEAKKGKVNSGNLVTFIISYESGDLNDNDTVELFSYLVKTGKAWHLQGHYGRVASALIEQNVIDNKGNILKRF